MVVSISLVTLFLVIRLVELIVLLKKVSRVCNTYDWKHADKYGYPVIEMLERDDYYMTSKWSAYNFLMMEGPNPLLMFFSLKPLTIEGQYNKEGINRLKEYEVI